MVNIKIRREDTVSSKLGSGDWAIKELLDQTLTQGYNAKYKLSRKLSKYLVWRAFSQTVCWFSMIMASQPLKHLSRFAFIMKETWRCHSYHVTCSLRVSSQLQKLPSILLVWWSKTHAEASRHKITGSMKQLTIYHIMGVVKIFSREATADFSRGSQKDFSGGKSDKTYFTHSKPENNLFAENLIGKCHISKSRWTSPPFRRPCTTSRLFSARCVVDSVWKLQQHKWTLWMFVTMTDNGITDCGKSKFQKRCIWKVVYLKSIWNQKKSGAKSD